MKILHFCPLPLFSGLEQYALTLLERQTAAGASCAMVGLKDSMLHKECEKRGFDFHSVEFDFTKRSLFQARSQYLKILASNPDAEVLHLHTTHDIPRLALTLWSSGRRVRKVIQQNHIWISHTKRDPLHWLTYQVVDEIWCSSEPAKYDLFKFLPVPKEKIQVVKYGRDLSLRQRFLSRAEARSKLALPLDAVVVGAVARLDRGKGIDELLRGAIKVMQVTPSNWHLSIIGGPTLNDPHSVVFAKQLNEICRGLPTDLTNRIHLHGAIADAAVLMPAFDIYCQVAYKETFSLALLDAQLANLPVLGTNTGGTPEVVKEGETGWLCEPRSIDSLAATLKRALDDHGNWKKFGEHARNCVEQEFDLEVVVKDVLRRYDL